MTSTFCPYLTDHSQGSSLTKLEYLYRPFSESWHNFKSISTKHSIKRNFTHPVAGFVFIIPAAGAIALFAVRHFQKIGQNQKSLWQECLKVDVEETITEISRVISKKVRTEQDDEFLYRFHYFFLKRTNSPISTKSPEESINFSKFMTMVINRVDWDSIYALLRKAAAEVTRLNLSEGPLTWATPSILKDFNTQEMTITGKQKANQEKAFLLPGTRLLEYNVAPIVSTSMQPGTIFGVEAEAMEIASTVTSIFTPSEDQQVFEFLNEIGKNLVLNVKEILADSSNSASFTSKKLVKLKMACIALKAEINMLPYNERSVALSDIVNKLMKLANEIDGKQKGESEQKMSDDWENYHSLLGTKEDFSPQVRNGIRKKDFRVGQIVSVPVFNSTERRYAFVIGTKPKLQLLLNDSGCIKNYKWNGSRYRGIYLVDTAQISLQPQNSHDDELYQNMLPFFIPSPASFIREIIDILNSDDSVVKSRSNLTQFQPFIFASTRDLTSRIVIKKVKDWKNFPGAYLGRKLTETFNKAYLKGKVLEDDIQFVFTRSGVIPGNSPFYDNSNIQEASFDAMHYILAMYTWMDQFGRLRNRFKPLDSSTSLFPITPFPLRGSP